MSKNKKVGVYCGHGIQTNGVMDYGCVYEKYTEAELCMRITESCVKWLKNSGVKVITDAPKNNINMIAQTAESNEEKVDIHVAFHCDYSAAPSGTIPLYVSSEGKKLAQKMNYYVLKDVKMKTRGLGKRSDLYELNGTNMPAVIFECGAIKADLKVLRDKYEAYGKACAHGICKYLGVKFKSTLKVKNPSGIKLPARGYFKMGDKSEKVLILQKWLKTHGFSPGTLDGIYGVNTVMAVKAFQKFYGLAIDGKFGKLSLSKANSLY